jgi:hypothetical protein
MDHPRVPPANAKSIRRHMESRDGAIDRCDGHHRSPMAPTPHQSSINNWGQFHMCYFEYDWQSWFLVVDWICF